MIPTTLNCNGKLLLLDQPKVMAVVNVTPDSFYDGGKLTNKTEIERQLQKYIDQGADIIDIGGMSSRPGAEIISPDQEWDRVAPALELMSKRFPEVIVSIDTVHSQVAEKAIEHGASIINDISAGSIDPRILEVAVEKKVPYILMHIQGKPKDMQNAPTYQNVVLEVLGFLKEKVHQLRNQGLKDIIIDAGYGFGKALEHNYELLKKQSVFEILGCPILTGISRKSMIYNYLDIAPAEALNGTTALHMIALQNGASILRVHDVAEAKQAIALHQMLEKV